MKFFRGYNPQFYFRTEPRESATYRCPRCHAQIRTLADEYGEHGCGLCGWEPEVEREAEREFYDFLRTAISTYVENCVEQGYIPDAFAFSTFYQREYGRVPGRIIDEMITKELAEYGGNNDK